MHTLTAHGPCAKREEINMSDNLPYHRNDDGRGEDERKDNAAGSLSAPKTAVAQPSTGARRGFAAMDEQTQRQIASKGGHSQGKENNRGNFWHDRERARIAGRKGGEAHGKNRLQPAGGNERH
jgi:general stress protein YciG